MSRGEGSQTEGPHSSFSVSVAKLLDRIDYRRADTAESREAIFRLRYQAYMRDGTITANASGTFSDHYDDTDNVYLFGLYVDGELASSIRIHVATREHPYFPTLEVFPEYLQPQLARRRRSHCRSDAVCRRRAALAHPSRAALCDASAVRDVRPILQGR
jgi:hypothetical protein